ncbi:DNA polymerase III subunit delta' [Campylobacter novaezeelandiae]|uniref:DNA polymerase III subunit delta' n=1 Tax=Campylobacter novaezeelandiae TaxID=2267891 RepID=UPI0019044F29|nr:DNA polymerase III subunit delta' [Campylobacter novaezeelandiae]MBK1964292.1 DNA polymerase III subunit delta' [Campylobacter novaezeelandiae]MBK1993597.1 DNA polymerase III subunit delta' [Campylobacter novaezeelandiae]
MSFVSKIIISNDFDGIKTKMIEDFGFKNLRFIPKEVTNEFLLDDARAVEKESYIAETQEKIIILMAYSFRTEAQNFLLKLLEEPPRNIKFLIVTPSKNLLLPTIKSRLICQKDKIIKEEIDLKIDLKKLDLKMIFEFIKENENLDKVELMQKISLLVQECLKVKKFKEEELDFFYKAYELAKLNSKASLLFATLLLNVYEA